ncbi:MAG: LacI family transcriptional regulator [bacterium]|nr:LacI family transcriptional regulator [bacterium]
MPKKRPDLKDVAKLAGVSPATVSTVINNRVGKNIRVGKETRQRILDAVNMLGYVANPAARSLAGQHNQILSVFTYEAIFPLEYHNFYYPFLVGIEQEAEQQGYDLLLMTSTGGNSGTRAIYRQGMNRLRLADGAILLGLSRNEEEILSLLQENFPVVFIGHRKFPGTDVSYVAADYTEVTAEIVGHIAQQGHTRIACIRDLSYGDTEPGADREAGYRLTHKILGLPLDSELIMRHSLETLTREEVKRLLHQGITAFVVETYALAYHVLTLFRKLSLDVPQDVSLAVLGGPMIPDAAHIDWTTFEIPCEEMGKQAVRTLVNILEDRTTVPVHLTLQCTLKFGATVGPASPAQPSGGDAQNNHE